jgi:hypothetical protein
VNTFLVVIPAKAGKNRRVHFLYAVIPAKATFVVMPAKAGIQALNGIARLARDLKT